MAPLGLPKFIAIISSLLQRVSDQNDNAAASASSSQSKTPALVSAFKGQSKLSMSICNYLVRIFRYANCSNSCYVVAYIYLDRFARRHTSPAIDSCSVHRFIVASVLTAVKFMDDLHYNNAYFAKVVGISLMEMNYLEVSFLFGVGFELNVTPVAFTSYCSILQREMYIQCPPAPQRVLCSLSEEESSSF